MTIDEAIAHAREVAEIQRNNDKLNKTLGLISPYYKTDCVKSAEEHEQIADWLEELKAYQQHEIICHKGYNAGYNKAIDDLLGGMNQITYNCQDADELFEKICDIAEQLKGRR